MHNLLDIVVSTSSNLAMGKNQFSSLFLPHKLSLKVIFKVKNKIFNCCKVD